MQFVLTLGFFNNVFLFTFSHYLRSTFSKLKVSGTNTGFSRLWRETNMKGAGRASIGVPEIFKARKLNASWFLLVSELFHFVVRCKGDYMINIACSHPPVCLFVCLFYVPVINLYVPYTNSQYVDGKHWHSTLMQCSYCTGKHIHMVTFTK